MEKSFLKQLIFSLCFTVFVLALALILKSSQREASAQGVSRVAARKDLKVTIDPRVGTPLLVSVPDVQTQFIELKNSSQAAGLEEKAKQFLQEYADLYQIKDPEQEFKIYKVLESKNIPGNSHVKLGQRKNGLRVFGAELIVHFKNQEITSVSGVYVPDIAASPIPVLTQDQALQIAQDSFEKSAQDSKELEEILKESQKEAVPLPEPELVYFNPGLIENKPSLTVLAWDVSLTTQRSFIDAQSGGLLFSYPRIHEVRNRDVYTSGNTNTLPGRQLMDESGYIVPRNRIPEPARTESGEAYRFSAVSYDYYQSTFQRDSFDDAGATILSTTNYLYKGCPNAFWNGTQLVYCTGLTEADDVVAHEFTHAVTEYSVGENQEGLIYSGQSGALNESYSDVFAGMVDREDWLIGEDLNGPPIRDMQDPPSLNLPEKRRQPDHLSHLLYLPYDPPCDKNNDECGVHRNSGIPNKAAYLLGELGAHEHYGVTVNGIGRDKTEQIYYRTLTEYLYPSSNFTAASIFTEQSCKDLIGQFSITSADCDEVHLAFQAVGLDQPMQEFLGEAAYDVFGSSVKSAGDVNGDGYDDMIVGAPGNENSTGKAFIYFGGPFTDNLADVRLVGETQRDFFGLSVSGAGDIDNDGYDDVIVGAYNDDDNGVDAGAAYIYRGGDPMDAIPDYKLLGEYPHDDFGFSVSGAGDVDGDGYDDVIVGAVWSDQYGGDKSGKAYVFRGGEPLNTTPFVEMIAEKVNDQFGYSVGRAGDVNNDGYDDVIVGAFANSTNTGKAYIYFGDPLMDDASDVTMSGEKIGDDFGGSVDSAGDVNGDGYDDVIVGAVGYANTTGKAYIFQGGKPMNGVADLSMTGKKVNDAFGVSVAGAGDMNKDGFGDVIVGAWWADGAEGIDRGEATIYFGAQEMDTVADVTVIGTQAGEYVGRSVAGAGDVNRDGYADVLVGAPGNDETATDAGKAYVLAGY